METNMDLSAVITVVASTLISIFVAYLTTNFSHRSMLKHEVWIRKESKYSEIIDNLCTLLKYYSVQMDSWSGVSNIADKELNALSCDFKSAKRTLEINNYSVGFLIDFNVGYELNELLKRMEFENYEEQFQNPFEYYDRVYGATKYAIEKIKVYAQVELNII